MTIASALAARALLAIASPATTVTTLAGNGIPGIADGPAAHASFLMPTGVAYDPRTRNVYIADAGAQRIRVLTPSNRITTLAGAGAFDAQTLRVAGGYRDGPVDHAQFDTPMAVAVDRRGRIYVADTGNGAIRKIENGVVSTIARTQHPSGVAVDSAGDVFVADPVDGLREVRPNGNVATIDESNAPVSIAVRESFAGRTLIVADSAGVLVIGPHGERERYRAFRQASEGRGTPSNSSELVHNIQGDKDIGIPYAISPAGANSFVYTDTRSSAVQLIDERFTRLQKLGGGDSESTMAQSAGLRDGEAADSLFDAPTGIAVTDGSSAIVADTGNRRLRLIRYGPLRDAIYAPAGLLPDPPLPARDYKVAFMGNSFIWYNTDWAASIEGLIEKQLSSAARRRVRIIPIGGTHFLSLAQAYMRATPGYYKMVVYSVNVDNACYACSLHGAATHRNANMWARRFTAELRKFKHYLDLQGVALLVAIHPGADELSPIEPAQTNLLLTSIEPDPFALRKLRQAVEQSGVPFIDTTHFFVEDYRSARHLPLFGTEDVHFTRHARAIFAQAIATELKRMVKQSAI